MAEQSKEPHDAVMIRQLLDSMGVEEYEPRVVHQLLDFMYGYVSSVLQDAEAYGGRAGLPKGSVEVDDVLTAIQSRAAFSFVQPPPQDILMSLAEKRNAQPLPEISKTHGLQLPPEDACLTAPTFDLPRPQQQGSPSGAPASSSGVSAPSGNRGNGGATDMEMDGTGSTPYPWKQQKQQAGSAQRQLLSVNPGEAPDD